MINLIKKIIKSSVQLVQGERDWESLAQLSYTSLNLAIKLSIAAVQRIQNRFDWQVVADPHFENSALTKKCLAN